MLFCKPQTIHHLFLKNHLGGARYEVAQLHAKANVNALDFFHVEIWLVWSYQILQSQMVDLLTFAQRGHGAPIY